MHKYSRILHRLLAVYILVVWVVLIVVVTAVVQQEVQTSKYQARYLSSITRQIAYILAPGSSTSIRFPNSGPYDQRMGYAAMPNQLERLMHAGFAVTQQAISSTMMTRLVDKFGLIPIYHEKAQAGLTIADQADQVIFDTAFPADGYPSFDEIPPVILNTLLFIENRELLNAQNVTVNPAIEWDRLSYAVIQMVANKLGIIHNVPGGSTLATQIEKYRHSPNGYTNSIKDKLRQMLTASIRAYLLGPDTREMRKEIALTYLNSMPLAATAKQGEVHGLGDGLTSWFGANFTEVNRLLTPEALKVAPISPEQAVAYRQVLNVLLSQRRPSYLLGRGFEALQNLTNSYLRILCDEGVISEALRDAALKASTVRTPQTEIMQNQFVTEKKTVAVLRTRLAKLLGIKSNYELDRMDLKVKTSLDYQTQQAVIDALHQLNKTDVAISAGLVGDKRLLNSNVDMAPIIYSLMLFERSDKGNLLRIQADNFDQPLDINEGIRIDLGSTAKMRTMVHYLELVTDVYQLYKDRPAKELKQIEIHPRDYLSAWVIDQLRANPVISLEQLLENALDRRYSASPGESFYTGGGLHQFHNFTRDENGKVMTIRAALRDSVNLVFIRLMREVAYHHLYKPDGIARWLENPDDGKRKEYLERFADEEGLVFLRRFYAKYKDKSPEEALDLLSAKVFHKTSRLTMLYQAIYPDADIVALKKYLHAQLPGVTLKDAEIEVLHEKYTPAKFDLQDQGFITKVHPLELWLVRYMVGHPNASKAKIFLDGKSARVEVYRWLFSSHRKNAQQRRILTLLEAEAFNQIHKAWKRTGYPFDALTPSYATAIGASGDRPAALAELVGIILNDGVRLPSVRFEHLHYAEGTPYETVLEKAPDQGVRVFAPEIARAARKALVGVVEGGTAVRLNKVYTDINGATLTVGGKTGTGDHRKEIWGTGGRLIESKFISRAATFAFFLGEHHFGVITAYVQGENAGNYHFTSALPVQIVKYLKPILQPLINKTPMDASVMPVSTLPEEAPQAPVPMGIPTPKLPEAVGEEPVDQRDQEQQDEQGVQEPQGGQENQAVPPEPQGEQLIQADPDPQGWQEIKPVAEPQDEQGWQAVQPVQESGWQEIKPVTVPQEAQQLQPEPGQQGEQSVQEAPGQIEEPQNLAAPESQAQDVEQTAPDAQEEQQIQAAPDLQEEQPGPAVPARQNEPLMVPPSQTEQAIQAVPVPQEEPVIQILSDPKGGQMIQAVPRVQEKPVMPSAPEENEAPVIQIMSDPNGGQVIQTLPSAQGGQVIQAVPEQQEAQDEPEPQEIPDEEQPLEVPARAREVP